MNLGYPITSTNSSSNTNLATGHGGGSGSGSSSSSSSSAGTSKSKHRVEHAEEVTDDESCMQLSDEKIDYAQLFDDNKNKILDVLPNLKIGMDLTRVSKKPWTNHQILRVHHV